MVRLLKPDRQRPRNYTSRREQLKLLALFVPLALVILAMTRLRHPKTAAAINAFFSPPQEQEGVSIKPRPPVAESGRQTDAAPKLFPGIDPNQLKTIEDNTYFRKGEKDAWFHFIGLLKDKPVDVANAAAVDYVQLVDQPDVYRGKLVTVCGTARQISAEKPAANDLGIKSYYRIVIQPAGGSNWPIIVYCLELPKGVSPSDKTNLSVNVLGLFFKKLSYKWQDGLGIAPVILANTIERNRNTASSINSAEKKNPDTSPKVAAASGGESLKTKEKSQANDEAFQQILELSGWNLKRFAEFDKGETLSEQQRIEALQLLRRLRSLDSTQLTKWSRYAEDDNALADPSKIYGKLLFLYGRVTKVTERLVPAQEADRLEIRSYFECELQTELPPGTATIITARVPKAFFADAGLAGTAFVSALYLKGDITSTNEPSYWVSKEVSWFPGMPGTTSSSKLIGMSPDLWLGKTLLGAKGLDVGQFELVEPRGRIRSQERELFYGVMHAIGQMPANVLVDAASENLPLLKKEWVNQSKSDSRRKALAQEVVRRADEGRYSVAMLFNDPEPQIGRLFVFDGLARRAIRVEVPKDVAEHYLFDHYYELEVFTDDSQNYPIIFCARELPKDFPVGSDIRVPVRVAGFFFKNWLYNATGRTQNGEAPGEEPPGPRAQFAPLIIGRAPNILQIQQSAPLAGSYVLGGLFVLALVGIWGAAVWFARDDRKFRERTPSAKYELSPGQSLNDLNLSAVEVPMTLDSYSPPET